jgi:hypothetical protein
MRTTRHGDAIAEQIQGEDAYGYYNELNLADVWTIIDNLHSHFLDTDRDTSIFERWMDELAAIDPEVVQ